MTAVLNVDTISNSAGTGAPSFPNGIILSGNNSSIIKDNANANYIITNTDGFSWVGSVTTQTANRTITLPAAASNIGRTIRISKYDSSAFTLIIATGNSGADTLDGASGSSANILTAQYSYVEVVCVSATAWSVIGASDILTVSLAIGTPISLTTGTTLGITNIPINQGRWVASGNVAFDISPTTVVTSLLWGLSKTSGSLGGGAEGIMSSQGEGFFVDNFPSAYVPRNDCHRIIPSTNVFYTAQTTLYLTAQSVFATSNMSVFGFLQAVRVG